LFTISFCRLPILQNESGEYITGEEQLFGTVPDVIADIQPPGDGMLYLLMKEKDTIEQKKMGGGAYRSCLRVMCDELGFEVAVHVLKVSEKLLVSVYRAHPLSNR
jgi:hypothetical protein